VCLSDAYQVVRVLVRNDAELDLKKIIFTQVFTCWHSKIRFFSIIFYYTMMILLPNYMVKGLFGFCCCFGVCGGGHEQIVD